MKWAALAAAVLGAVLVGVAVATAGGGGGAGPDPAAAPAADRAPGLAVFAAQGCGSCHTFAPAGATGTMAPDLGASLDGKPAGFIRESIVDPAAAAEPGSIGATMPPDYAERMTPEELDALIGFLATPPR